MQLTIKNLTKTYGEKVVLKDIDFTFEEGKIYGLIGRNGAGKTTFFNCLNEDVEIDKGEVILSNEYGENKLTTEDIGYVISTPTVPEFLTGREFLKFFIDINKKRIKDLKTTDEYFDFMKIEKEDRDRLVLSKGHCAPALYATLALKGFFKKEELDSFRKVDGILQGHPDMKKIPGVDMTTGSLGQGLSAAGPGGSTCNAGAACQYADGGTGFGGAPGGESGGRRAGDYP